MYNSFVTGYLVKALTIILQDERRDSKDRIHYYLCVSLLSRYDEIAENYKFIARYSKCKDIVEFFSQIFSCDISTIKSILIKLSDYKNVDSKESLCQCLGTSVDS